MRQITIWRRHGCTFRYTLYGALFGLAFPVFSSLADLFMQHLPLTLHSLLQVQRSSPLHWVIDTAPLFLGLFASFAGSRQDWSTWLNERLQQQVQERDEAIDQLARLQANLEQQVAERVKAEKALKIYATQLERSNQELHDFLYAASHDLQEPLRKMRAFGNRLQTGYGDTLDEQGINNLTRMQKAAAQMQALIEGLVGYSQVTTKAQCFVTVDLGQIACEVMSDLETPIEQVGGRVEIDGLPIIEADPTQMRQLLKNLIGNALKFHRQDEAPIVKVQVQLLNGNGGLTGENMSHAELYPENARCQITVEDNGIGFDEKYLDRIFQVFERLHGQGEYEGTGIGLATCRKIVERHGGEITARSAPEQGATFIVTLPVRQTQNRESQ
jgi:light-regulated signal transduction histidine kinase (bacteriophytochrome)